MDSVSLRTRAIHEAGHVVVARECDIQVYDVSIEQVSPDRYGYTVTGKPLVEDVAQACAELSGVDRLNACRVYARIALGGVAAELVDQQLARRAILKPTPCNDARTAEAYLRMGTTLGRVSPTAVQRELNFAMRILLNRLREWQSLATALVQHQRLSGSDLESVFGLG
jgi:hypothetical protein